MRQEIRRGRLCGLLIIALLFSGISARMVSADSTFPKQISLSLAESCRVISDIYTDSLFDADGDNHQSFIPQRILGTNHEAGCWLPIQKILSAYFNLLQETSEGISLRLRWKGDSVIRYIHRQDGKKN